MSTCTALGLPGFVTFTDSLPTSTPFSVMRLRSVPSSSKSARSSSSHMPRRLYGLPVLVIAPSSL